MLLRLTWMDVTIKQLQLNRNTGYDPLLPHFHGHFFGLFMQCPCNEILHSQANEMIIHYSRLESLRPI